MNRFLTLLCICMLLTTTTVDAKTAMKVNASMLHRAPTNRTAIQRVLQGDSKISLKYKDCATEGWIRFQAPRDGRYVFVFSDIKQNLKSTESRPAIFCFYNKFFVPRNIDGLSCESNGFALGYNSDSSRRTSYKNELGVSMVLEKNEIINISCSGILDTTEKAKASFSLSISLEE